MKSFLYLLFLFVPLSMTACLEKKNESNLSTGIQWYPRSLESALQVAKEQSKPLFVYWGAKWCPPCNVVQATLFKDKRVIQASKKFLSVYLDGDTESAQRWGEQLRILGYPTLMVLNAEGKEVVRLDSSNSSTDFATALDSAYNNLYPVDDLIQKVLSEKAKNVPESQWQLLAGFSWSQAHELKDRIDFAEAYWKLYRHIPKKMVVERRQFLLNGLLARLEQVKEKPLVQKEKNEFLREVQKILGDPEALQVHFKSLAYNAKEVASAFFETSSAERASFIESYKQSFAELREKLEAGSYDHLVTFYPLVDLPRIDNSEAQLSETDKELIKEEMLKVVDKTVDSHQQVFITNSASYLLREAGWHDLARQILKKDIEKSKTAYYSMASLASLEKKAGNQEEALKWIERAYHSSKGHATRLQWGSNYLIYLFEIKPNEDGRIFLELQKYYREHVKSGEAFMGRNKSRLNKLSKKLKEWGVSKKRKTQIRKLQKKWLARCEKKSKIKTDHYQNACRDYFHQMI